MTTIDALVDKFYAELEDKTSGLSFRKSVKRPEIVIKDRKTFIVNFSDVCSSVDRNMQNVADFMAKELTIDTSITANGELIVHGVFHKQKLEELVKRFVASYVQCPNCKSCCTQLYKSNRITYISCGKCRAHTAINL